MKRPAAIASGLGALALLGAGVGVKVATDSSGCGYTICASGATSSTFSAAIASVQPGDVIGVQPGTYPAQGFLAATTKPTGPAVVFDGNGATVTGGESLAIGVSGACTGGKHLEFQDFKLVGSATTRCGADDIILRDLDAASFNLSGGSNIQVLGGDYGPKINDVNQLKGGVTGVVIDGIYAHNFTISDPAKHAECLHIWGAKNAVIENSIFQNCTDRDIFAKREGGLIIDGIVVQNNQFDSPMPGNTATSQCVPTCPRGGNSVQFSQSGGQITNSIIRNNRALTSFSNEGQAGVVMSANIFSGFVPPTNSGTNIQLSLVLSNEPPPTTTTETTTTETTTTTTDTTTTTEPTTTTTETTTTEPPPADSLPVTIQSQDATTVTLGWTPVPGIGYRFLVDGTVVSHTWDQNRATVKFAKKPGSKLEVQQMVKGVSGSVVSP